MWFLPLILFSVLTLLWFHILSGRKESLKYWFHRHVPTLRQPHYFFGDIKNVLFGRENLAATLTRAYFALKSQGHEYGGLYFMKRPIFVPIDPQLVRKIIVKDFDHFVDRGIMHDVTKKPLSAHLFNINGDEWKQLRQKLTSTFTTGKLKGMIDTLHWHADNLVTKIEQVQVAKSGSGIELNDYFEQVGIDIIGHVAFGLECNTLKSQESTFYKMSKRIFQPKFSSILKFLLFVDFSNPGNLITLTTSDRELCDFFLTIIKDTVQSRKQHQQLEDAAPKRKDFMQMLVDIHNNSQLSVEEIAAQTFLFFMAAFETSSKAVNLTLYELSKNTQLQEKLRHEVRENIKTYSYEELMQNKYLDLIVKETLRKYPSVVFLHRQCTKKYEISPKTTLEKGTILVIPIFAFHNDPEYFPAPDVYDPYRFDDENGKKIDPLTYFPFGDGPRNCIGMRFGLLQVKLILSMLIANFEFAPSRLTEEPLDFNPVTDNLLLTIKQNIYFNVKKINSVHV